MRIDHLRALGAGLGTCLIAVLLAQSCQAELYINEIFFDPPAGFDVQDEYIELRGTPGMSLDDHYLIFLESEGNEDAGGIDNIFDLNGTSIGSNGFLLLRQKGNVYSNVAPGTTDLVNAGPNLGIAGLPPGFGSGVNSTIGASDDLNDGVTENGGFTALLIRNDTGDAPSLSDDLDQNNDGFFGGVGENIVTGKVGWSILDSISQAEVGEDNAIFYGAINFQPSSNTGAIAQYGSIVDVPYEIEHMARWGNSTGQTAEDWHITNVTNNSGSGYQGRPNYRQSRSDNHPLSDGDNNTPAPQTGPGLGAIESNKGVPYGTILLDNLGAPNYMTGDFNGDGVADPADYAAWRNSLGTVGNELAHPAADHNHDFLVDGADLQIWIDNIGSPQSSLPGAIVSPSTASVPEPSALALGSLLVAGVASRRGRRS